MGRGKRERIVQAADGREEGKPSAAPVSPRVPLCGILAAGVENVYPFCLFRQRWARVRKSRTMGRKLRGTRI